MNPNNNVTEEQFLVLRRFSENFPNWGIVLPIAMVFVTLLLLAFFRRESKDGLPSFTTMFVWILAIGWVALTQNLVVGHVNLIRLATPAGLAVVLIILNIVTGFLGSEWSRETRIVTFLSSLYLLCASVAWAVWLALPSPRFIQWEMIVWPVFVATPLFIGLLYICLKCSRVAFATLVIGALTIGWVALTQIFVQDQVARNLAPAILGFVLIALFIVCLVRGRGWAKATRVAALAGGLCLFYASGASVFKPVFSWWVILAPVLLVGLFYISLMYMRDAKTIHPAWAIFLGVCRSCVYVILTIVFLLPGCQTYQTSETHSKVVFLIDVSGSMGTVDDLPKPGDDPGKLPSRQDKIAAFLLDAPKDNPEERPFLDRVLGKSPLTAYRFGTMTDDVFVKNLTPDSKVDVDGIRKWLEVNKDQMKLPDNVKDKDRDQLQTKLNYLYNALLDGTNIGGSAFQAAKLEAGNYIQAVILISDGQSNTGSAEALEDFLLRMNAKNREVPVFTISVGNYRQPASIRIEDLVAPESVRPVDKFPINVPVTGAGLTDEEFEAELVITQIKNKAGQKIIGGKSFTTKPLKGQFKGAGDFPQGKVSFTVDLAKQFNIDRKDKKQTATLEGTWEIKARVPRNPREAFAKTHHESDPPVQVQVVDRKLRVLLFAGGPTRDYQFLRTVLYRESKAKRMELTVFLQTAIGEKAVDQDVSKERLLTHFPSRLGKDSADDPYSSLNVYDVVIAMDPDWTKLKTEELKNLKEWVLKYGGGVVFVAGPVYTFHLARPGGRDFTALNEIVPVKLKDSRLHNLGIGHDPSKPYLLEFTNAAKAYHFWKISEDEKDKTGGWDKFFWRSGKPPTAKNMQPDRGMFNYYPLEKLMPGAITVASFDGPPSSRVGKDKQKQPFLVLRDFGQGGKTFYISSGESWRLRHYQTKAHERFWIRLVQFMASGTSVQQNLGQLYARKRQTVGIINMEAKLKNSNLKPLAEDSVVVVKVTPPKDFDEKKYPNTKGSFALDPKKRAPGKEWDGDFIGKYKAEMPGEYRFELEIPGTGKTLSKTIMVTKPNVELDNVRNDPERLYQIASPALKILGRLDADTRKEIKRILRRPANVDVDDSAERLYFPLEHAQSISKCLVKLDPKRESIKGALDDLWDDGYESGYQMRLDYILYIVLGAVGLLGMAILLFIGRPIAAVVMIGIAAFLCLAVFIATLVGDYSWIMMPLGMSTVLGTLVALLSIEWLTRKLLKLA